MMMYGPSCKRNTLGMSCAPASWRDKSVSYPFQWSIRFEHYFLRGNAMKPLCIQTAIDRIHTGESVDAACNWVWQWLTSEDRNSVDAYLVEIQHSLAFEAGTQEGRYKAIVRELTAQCPTCCRAPESPLRRYDKRGKVVEGCVDGFHSGKLVSPSESAHWHNRKESKAIRKQLNRLA